jgi:ATP-dependent Clp protease ATP-binding subunit ClpA
MDENRSPFSKLTDRSRMVMRRAVAAAKQFGKADVGPNELLHALAFTEGGVAARALQNVGWTPTDNLSTYEFSPEIGDLTKSSFLEKIAAVAQKEAYAFDHRYSGTEHLLLALVRLYPDVVADPEKVRHEVLSILGHDLE